MTQENTTDVHVFSVTDTSSPQDGFPALCTGESARLNEKFHESVMGILKSMDMETHIQIFSPQDAVMPPMVCIEGSIGAVDEFRKVAEGQQMDVQMLAREVALRCIQNKLER